MSFSEKRWAYSDMPSFLSQSEISCIAATDGLVVVQPSFGPGQRRPYPDISRTARFSPTTESNVSRDVQITVEGSGAGIDPQNIDRIFDAFYTTKSSGMGMGLSICRSIVEAQNGRLWVSPGADHGSVFELVLPPVSA